MEEEQLSDEILSFVQGAGQCLPPASEMIAAAAAQRHKDQKPAQGNTSRWYTPTLIYAYGEAYRLLQNDSASRRASRTVEKWGLWCVAFMYVLFAAGGVLILCGATFVSLRLLGSAFMTLSLAWAFTKLTFAFVTIRDTLCEYERAEVTRLLLSESPGSAPGQVPIAMKRAWNWYWGAVGRDWGKAEGVLWKLLMLGVLIFPAMLSLYLVKLCFGGLLALARVSEGMLFWEILIVSLLWTAAIAWWRWALSRVVQRAVAEARAADSDDLLFQVAHPGVSPKLKQYY